MLTFAPISFLIALLVAMGDRVRKGFRRMFAQTSGKFTLGLIFVLVAGQAAWAMQRVQDGLAVLQADYQADAEGELPDAYPRGEEVAPWFELQNQHAENIDLAELRGKSVILTFAFAHCQTVCPALVHNAKSALGELPEETSLLLIVTLDPWRDTPLSIPGIAKRWGLERNAYLLSGDPSLVEEIHLRYGIPTERDMKSGDIAHPPLVFVIDPQGRLAYTFNNPPISWLTAAVQKLSTES
jgi:cytochrome oxidase Cu insertion factor (SCO1/SenC/PrrC family)